MLTAVFSIISMKIFFAIRTIFGVNRTELFRLAALKFNSSFVVVYYLSSAVVLNTSSKQRNILRSILLLNQPDTTVTEYKSIFFDMFYSIFTGCMSLALSAICHFSVMAAQQFEIAFAAKVKPVSKAEIPYRTVCTLTLF